MSPLGHLLLTLCSLRLEHRQLLTNVAMGQGGTPNGMPLHLNESTLAMSLLRRDLLAYPKTNKSIVAANHLYSDSIFQV